jgi:Virus neck protein
MTSVYFNNQNATREQILIEDMIIESIKNHGIDVYYLPRESQSELDRLFGDDPVKSFSTAYSLEMYLESFQDFEGNQEFFSKFGLQIQKEARVAVARRTFEKNIPTGIRNVPKEGDLIYLRVQQKLLEIKFVEEEKNFFQLGKSAPYMYSLNLEVFRYNGERLTTGIAEIDAIADGNAYGIEYTMGTTGTNTYTNHEIVYQGASLANSTARGYVTNWDLPTKKLIIRNIKGSFAPGVLIKGADSGAQWLMVSNNPQENANDVFEENVLLETEADNILDWTETNPFGTIDENY